MFALEREHERSFHGESEAGYLPRILPAVYLEEEINMQDTMLKLYIRMKDLLSQDEGQDLVEYALVVAFIAVAAVAAIRGVAPALGSAFTNITGILNGAL